MPEDETQRKDNKIEYPKFEEMSYAEILAYIDKEAKRRLGINKTSGESFER